MAVSYKRPCVAVIRGVGCIFTEMVSGSATFPGTKDAWDQLDRIWQVSAFSFGWLVTISYCASRMQPHSVTQSRSYNNVTCISDAILCVVRTSCWWSQ